MPLTDVLLPTDPVPLPAGVAAFLADADRRITDFQQAGRVTAFEPSDYAGAYEVLARVMDSSLARGSCFCEWGCGFGVVAALAAGLGFAAYGIEIADELIVEARQLADDHELPVEFVRGSFIPRDAEDRVAAAGAYSWLTTEADDAYAEFGLEPDDFDVVFAYPWPDEEVATAEMFERSAGVGALLITYHVGDGFRVRRKVRRKR